MIKKLSQYDVTTTIDRLDAILKDKGIISVARVDHAAAAKKLGLELRPTQVLFFGNPKLGTPLMQNTQTIGLDLPMRVLAWEEENGETWLGYHLPQKIADAHGAVAISDAAKALGDAVDNLTNAAAGIS